MRTHLEIQQREDIRRDLAERMKFVPPDLRARENVFFLQQDPSKIHQGQKSGKWLNVEIIAINGANAAIQNWLQYLLGDHQILWIWKNFQTRVSEQEHLFYGNSYWSAILDRQGPPVAAPTDLRTKKADNLTPQQLQGFGYKLK